MIATEAERDAFGLSDRIHWTSLSIASEACSSAITFAARFSNFSCSVSFGRPGPPFHPLENFAIFFHFPGWCAHLFASGNVGAG
jgi:hypothetical protein